MQVANCNRLALYFCALYIPILPHACRSIFLQTYLQNIRYHFYSNNINSFSKPNGHISYHLFVWYRLASYKRTAFSLLCQAESVSHAVHALLHQTQPNMSSAVSTVISIIKKTVINCFLSSCTTSSILGAVDSSSKLCFSSSVRKVQAHTCRLISLPD